MTNVFLEGYDLDSPFLFPILSSYLKKDANVCIIPLGFRPWEVDSHSEWQAFYGEGGRYHGILTRPFASFGIPKEHIRFLHFFEDPPALARRKVEEADILYLPGGLPHLFPQRMDAMGITEAVRSHQGTVLGFSAGAMVQLREYHISPDGDYPVFSYQKGLGLVDGFYLEVHYDNSPAQRAAVAKVLSERNAPLFCTRYGASCILVEKGEPRLFGDVTVFQK